MFVMNSYSLSNLSDSVLLRRLAELVARDRVTMAAMLAHIAEVDSRRLYLPAAYPSMHAYCVRELRLSEDAAYRGITAARAARQFPAIFEAIAGGNLSLSAVGVLAPYLATANASELLKAAAHKSESEIDQLIAERFPRSEMLALVTSIPPARSLSTQLVPERVGMTTPEQADARLAPARVEDVAPQTRVAPIAAQRFALQFSIGQSAYDKLRHVQELLSHQIGPGDLAGVFERSLDALLAHLGKSRCAATSRPQRNPRPTTSRRHVPAHVMRAVRERDGDRCTFVSESGKRCEERSRLQLEHIVPVARGGEATAENIRMLCHSHNQHTADCEFGRGFMEEKRRAAKAAGDERAQEKAAAHRADMTDVVSALMNLGYRADEARQAASLADSISDATLEEKLKLALSYFRARTLHRSRAACHET